jgi:hypothetical protein
MAERYGFRLYPTDDVMSDHAGRSTPVDSPHLAEFIAMDMDDRWLNRPPEVMLDTFHWYRGEGFNFIVDDLRALPSRPNVVVEGFRLLPHLVRPLLDDPRHAVWLVPTDDFRRSAFESRGSTWRIAGQTSDPDRALRNLLERDRMFTEGMAADATRLGLTIVEVDSAMSEDALFEHVVTWFGLDTAGSR